MTATATHYELAMDCLRLADNTANADYYSGDRDAAAQRYMFRALVHAVLQLSTDLQKP